MVTEGSGARRQRQRGFWALAGVLLLNCIAGAAGAQKPATVYEADLVELNLPALAANRALRTDAVSELNRRLQGGSAALNFDGASGYLRSLLELLDISVDSQMAVYSKTSLQSPIITPSNPRTIFFNDTVAVGWMRGGMIEVAALDPALGVGFYVLPPVRMATPLLRPETSCTSCHYSAAAEGVPGFLLRSVPTAADGALLPWLGNATMDLGRRRKSDGAAGT